MKEFADANNERLLSQKWRLIFLRFTTKNNLMGLAQTYIQKIFRNEMEENHPLLFTEGKFFHFWRAIHRQSFHYLLSSISKFFRYALVRIIYKLWLNIFCVPAP